MASGIGPTAGVEAVPVSGVERITNLDTVRGIATLGILVMNAVSYGLPEAAYFNLDAAGSDTWLDWVIGVAGEVFVDQKTMALFSMLFGAGIVLFADRAASKTTRPGRLSLWRNLLLFGIGVLHAVIWEGDILTVYALCSPVLLVLRNKSPRILLGLGAVLVVMSAVWAAGAQAAIPADGAGLGSYWFVGGGEIGDTAGLFLIVDFFARSLGMMLIGVGLFRLGIVQGGRSTAFYHRMAIIGFGIGFPLAIAGVTWQIAADFSPNIALIAEAPGTLATIPLAMGYLAVITLWNQRPDTFVHERLRAVGRMALTNYLVHTIVGITLMRVVLDRGDLTRTSIAAFILAVWTAQLVWSTWWLRRFRFGPVEWIWRSATYRSIQPLRRS